MIAMAQAKNTLGTDRPAVGSPNNVLPEHHDLAVHAPITTPKSPVVPLDKTKDASGTENLQTTAGSTETSSSINAGMSNCAADHGEEYAENHYDSLSARGPSLRPSPTARAGIYASELAAKALRAESDGEDASMNVNSTVGPVVPLAGYRPLRQRRGKNGTTNTTAPQSLNRREQSDRLKTVPATTEGTADEKTSTAGTTRLPGTSENNKPQSDSDDDGLPRWKSRPRPLTTRSGNTAEATDIDLKGAADADCRLGTLQREADDGGRRDEADDTGALRRVDDDRGAEVGEDAEASEPGHIGSNDWPQAQNGGHSATSQCRTRQHGLQKRRPLKIPNSKQESNNEASKAYADADVTRFDKGSILHGTRVAAPQAATAPRTSADGQQKATGSNAASKKRKKVSDPLTQDVRYGKRAFRTATGSRSTGAVQSKGIHLRRVDVAFRESSSEVERRGQSGGDSNIAAPDSLRHDPAHHECDNGTAQESATPCTTISANGPYTGYQNNAEISDATQEVEVPAPSNERSTPATTSSRFLLSSANLQIITPDGDGSVKVEIEGHWNIKFVDKPVPFPSRGSPSTIWVSPMRPLHP